LTGNLDRLEILPDDAFGRRGFLDFRDQRGTRRCRQGAREVSGLRQIGYLSLKLGYGNAALCAVDLGSLGRQYF